MLAPLAASYDRVYNTPINLLKHGAKRWPMAISAPTRAGPAMCTNWLWMVCRPVRSQRIGRRDLACGRAAGDRRPGGAHGCGDRILTHSASGRSTRWAWLALARASRPTATRSACMSPPRPRHSARRRWYWRAVRCCGAVSRAPSESIRALIAAAIDVMRAARDA